MKIKGLVNTLFLNFVIFSFETRSGGCPANHPEMSVLEPVAQTACAGWSCLAFLVTFWAMQKVTRK